MDIVKYIGLCLLALVWAGLCIYMLVARGVTLYNLLVVAISGGIVFVPLWKKFIRNDKTKR